MFRKTLLALAVGAAFAVSMPTVFAQDAQTGTSEVRTDHRRPLFVRHDYGSHCDESEPAKRGGPVVSNRR